MQVYKPHPNIAIRSTVTINLSASQWQLKTDDWPRVIVERVADFLNKRITHGYNKGEPPAAIRYQYEILKESFVLYITPETDNTFNNIHNALFNE